MATPAGVYRHRLIIEQMVDRPNALGESVPTAEAVCPVWGRVEGLMAREFLAADRTKSTISYKVRLRTLPWLTAKYRFRWMGRILNIQSVLPRGERLEELECFCAEEVD
jgi:SPP1 family predicted phage head-tail adaptor